MKNKLLTILLLASATFVSAGTKTWNFTVIQEGAITSSSSTTFKFSCGGKELENRTTLPGPTVSFSCHNDESPSLQYILNGHSVSIPAEALNIGQNFNINADGITQRK